MRPKIDLVVVTAVILCAAVLAGEVLTYSSVHHYDADAEWGEGSVDYRVSSSGGDVYDAVLIGNARPVDKLMLYVDDRYDSTYRLSNYPMRRICRRRSSRSRPRLSWDSVRSRMLRSAGTTV